MHGFNYLNKTISLTLKLKLNIFIDCVYDLACDNCGNTRFSPEVKKEKLHFCQHLLTQCLVSRPIVCMFWVALINLVFRKKRNLNNLTSQPGIV